MFWIIPAVGVAWVLISSLKRKPKQKEPESPKPPTGPGIERRISRQIIQTPDGGEVVLSETVKYAGVDEQGLLVDEERQIYASWHCNHTAREGYGGRCRSCGASHCTLAECSVNCAKCGAALVRTSEGKR